MASGGATGAAGSAGARETEKSLEVALQEQESAALELNRVAGPYQVIQRQVQSDRALYDSVLTRLKQTDVLAGVQPGMGKVGNVRVVEPPIASSRPVKPSRLRTLLLALVGGTILGVAAAVTREFFNVSFRTVDEAEKGLSLPGLAAVPEIRLQGSRMSKGASDLPMVHYQQQVCRGSIEKTICRFPGDHDICIFSGRYFAAV